jgi:hypothetical protein
MAYHSTQLPLFPRKRCSPRAKPEDDATSTERVTTKEIMRALFIFTSFGSLEADIL